ncbi:amino acid permease [Colletotrichum scovillei]|uniref:Amino acid permease n=1 Tax=Colletotrichum scovillei TaxID=1209932 RepID=A0A9P7RDH1_9PEZI|nr:amino acid permease [Colletotrichum scovillei]KAG7074930.1 amino acid permease [Colletotrichum scovillei]KAG7082062.1 amino acid permease [Colletotrichum scovillei]
MLDVGELCCECERAILGTVAGRGQARVIGRDDETEQEERYDIEEEDAAKYDLGRQSDNEDRNKDEDGDSEGLADAEGMFNFAEPLGAEKRGRGQNDQYWRYHKGRL